MESDHKPIYVDLKGQIKRGMVATDERRSEKMIWMEELKEKLKENMEGVEFDERFYGRIESVKKGRRRFKDYVRGRRKRN